MAILHIICTRVYCNIEQYMYCNSTRVRTLIPLYPRPQTDAGRWTVVGGLPCTDYCKRRLATISVFVDSRAVSTVPVSATSTAGTGIQLECMRALLTGRVQYQYEYGTHVGLWIEEPQSTSYCNANADDSFGCYSQFVSPMRQDFWPVYGHTRGNCDASTLLTENEG